MTTLHAIDLGHTAHHETLTCGALVTYHGRLRSEHHTVFYIAAVDGCQLTLIDRDYPQVTVLRQVSCGHVRPCGGHVVLCGCGHEAGNGGRGGGYGYCDAQPCECRDHYEIRTY